jgi:hypothetical protein
MKHVPSIFFILLTVFSYYKAVSQVSGGTVPMDLNVHNVFALQTKEVLFFETDPTLCDSIYESPDSMALYKIGIKDVLDFNTSKLMPIVVACRDNSGNQIYSLVVKLNINSQGKVIAANVIRPALPYNCREQIQNAYLKMENWKPAKHNGIRVCTTLNVPISCLKWQ